MILKALYDYYYRCKSLPARGLELKEIAFLIVVDQNGNFLRFEDRRINNKQAQEFLVVKSVGRTSSPIANYLYDNSEYVLGCYIKDKTKEFTTNIEKFNTFKLKVESIYSKYPDNSAIKAVASFYKNDLSTIIDQITHDPLWDEIKKNLNKRFSNFSFIIQGDTEIIAEKKSYILLLTMTIIKIVIYVLLQEIIHL